MKGQTFKGPPWAGRLEAKERETKGAEWRGLGLVRLFVESGWQSMED